MKVDMKTPFVIFASCVEVLASLTHVNNEITLPFKIKLMITIMKEMEPPKAAPNNFDIAYALQIGALTTLP